MFEYFRDRRIDYYFEINKIYIFINYDISKFKTVNVRYININNSRGIHSRVI